MTEAPLLAARKLCRRVRDGDHDITILASVDIEIAAGERVALLGPSGSGKSSLLYILGALDSHYEGTVEVDGRRLDGLGDRALARIRNQTFGFVFQAYNLLGHLSALDNVLLPARFGDGVPNTERAREVLSNVGLGDKMHRRPRALSGGERQRVAIARAICHRPKLVLCDEPTGNLDAHTGAEILTLFDQLAEDRVALLVATHDEAIARSADRVLHLREGRLT